MNLYIDTQLKENFKYIIPHRKSCSLVIFPEEEIFEVFDREAERIKYLRKKFPYAQPRWRSPFDFYTDLEINRYIKTQT